MNFNMKNKIWKKLGALGMAFLMTGMVLGGCGEATVYAAEEAYAYEASEDYEWQENEPEEITESMEVTGLEDFDTKEAEAEGAVFEEAGTEESESDESKSEEPEECDDPDDTEQGDSSLSDGESEEVNKETENEKKNPDFTIHAATDENTVKAGSDLVYTVTLENTGDVMLKNVQLQALFTDQNLQGEWSGGSSETVDLNGNIQNEGGNTIHMEQLDSGIKETLYLTVKLPEAQESAVSVKIAASAEPETTEADTENTVLSREVALETGVIPLKASFEVTKTADRSVAVPGDKILFQICIRNTGERTLHSVITTERFRLGKVPVQFLEKEGVVLNKAKTKARIEKIEPGKAAGLQAMVTLPENIKEQELLNEVTVTTLETGEQVMTSQARIQVKAASETKEDSENSVDNDSVDTDGGAVSHAGASYPASTHPKTGDPYQPLLWLAMIPGSIIAAGWIRRRM